jgi:alginate O-acetyltransferase complex protein AlgJ
MHEPESPFRHAASVGQGVAVIALLAWGFWQGVQAMTAPDSMARIRETMNVEALLQGRTAAAVNHAMAHDLPVDAAFRATGGLLRWNVFRSAGPQVRAGCDDWLFLTEELRPWPEAEAHQQRRIVALGAIAAHLRQKGIQLVVAVVPDKARVYGDMLCGAPRSAQAEQRHAGFVSALQGASLPFIDLLPVLEAGRRETSVFYRTDTHWNQRGAALSAQAIAPVVRQNGIAPSERFITTAAADSSLRAGDLLRLMSLDHVPDWLRPHADVERQDTTAAAEPAANGGGGLLDEAPAPPVALIGSSFSVNANFHGRLQESLGVPVANFALAGGGFYRAAAAYFDSAAFRETPPKLVVWEIPERVIGQPIDPTEAQFLGRW